MVFQPKSYKWRDGTPYTTSPEIVGGVVEGIETRDGVVTKEAFLDASRPEESPTHSMFEWDDSIAAEKYRLSQSNKIIGALQIIYDEPKGNERSVSAFVNVKSERKAEYKNIVDALSDRETRELVLERVRREVEALIERNRGIDGLADILREALAKLEEGA